MNEEYKHCFMEAVPNMNKPGAVKLPGKHTSIFVSVYTIMLGAGVLTCERSQLFVEILFDHFGKRLRQFVQLFLDIIVAVFEDILDALRWR